LNRNKLLWRDESADGVKTGHTDAAGYCLVGSAKRGGMRLITVVAGSSSDKDRFSDTQRLLEYGFRFFATQKVISADQQLKEIAVWGGLADSLKIGVIQDISLTLPRTSFKDLQINYKHKNNVQAPIKKGELIGSLEIVSGDKVVYAQDLLALESVDSKGFFGRVWSKFILWIMGLFGLNDNGSN
jgi:D-alanyl-D-alanine carboxypeptidase (penicillin-binding protein 5/6)